MPLHCTDISVQLRSVHFCRSIHAVMHHHWQGQRHCHCASFKTGKLAVRRVMAQKQQSRLTTNTQPVLTNRVAVPILQCNQQLTRKTMSSTAQLTSWPSGLVVTVLTLDVADCPSLNMLVTFFFHKILARLRFFLISFAIRRRKWQTSYDVATCWVKNDV